MKELTPHEIIEIIPKIWGLSFRSANNVKARYSKYSNFNVGVAIISSDDQIILGCNIESAAYPSTMCAERVAIYSALSQGISKFKAIAIVSSLSAKPCGPCRQIIYEYLGNIPIYISDGKNITNYEDYLYCF